MKKFIKEFIQQDFPFLITVPALVWQIFFFLIPTIFLFLLSLWVSGGNFLTLSNYASCFNKVYFLAIWNSLTLAYLTAFFCILFCFPIALILNLWIRKELRLTILFFLMLPSWTNFIVRIYSWFFLLKNDGILFKALSLVGLIGETSSLLATFPTTIVVMVYCYFPFILIPLNSAIGNIDKRTLESAADLGSSSLQTFFYVILPMSIRGIFFGFVVVVLSAFGDFVVPDFIGGGLNVYWGNLVLYKFVYLADFHVGGAIIFFGLACLLLSILIFFFFLRGLLFIFGHKIGLSEKLLYLKLD